MNIVTDFRKLLDDELKRRGITMCTWQPGSRSSRNLLELSTSPRPTVLYVKEFNVFGRPGFWGLTRNQVNCLNKKSTVRWFAVLLLRSATIGYVLTDTEARRGIDDGSFELSGDGDYKVNENLDLKLVPRLESLSQLLDRILDVPAA